MSIHKEGRIILIGFLITLSLIGYGIILITPGIPVLHYIVIILFGLLYLWMLWFFRVPKIQINKNDKGFLAPADGKIVAIERITETEYLNEDRIQISIFMNPLNVHQNRIPVSGKIKYIKYHPGKYLVAWHPKSSTKNERTTIVIERPDGLLLLIRQIAGAMARRIKWYIKEGDSINQGEEFGFIRFGSRLDTLVPLEASVCVKIGDTVKAGQSVLADY